MKKSLPPFLAGVLTTVLLGSIALPAFANIITARTAIEVDPVNILVNGETFVPHDVNGNEVAVFAYNGTTYAPLRALAEAYGLKVGYDAEKNMATVVETGEEAYKTNSEETYSFSYDYEEFKGLWNDPIRQEMRTTRVVSSNDNRTARYLATVEPALKDSYFRQLANELCQMNKDDTHILFRYSDGQNIALVPGNIEDDYINYYKN